MKRIIAVFGPADIKKEYLYIVKRKSMKAKRSLLAQIKGRPSWHKIFEEKLSVLEGK